MNRNIRTIVITAALLTAVAFAVPGVNAVDAPDEGDGEKFCRRVIGINACVAVLYEDCTFWLSAGAGGCWVQGGPDDPFLNTA